MARKRRQAARPSTGSIFQTIVSEHAVALSQLGALAVGIAGVIWSVYTYHAPAQAVAATREYSSALETTLREQDLRFIVTLHGAVDDVTVNPPGHRLFEDGERIFPSFMTAREELLKRYMLSEPFLAFFKRFEEYKTTPTLPNRLLMLQEARKLSSALDATAQRIGRNPRS